MLRTRNEVPARQRVPNAEIFRPAADMSSFMVAWKTVNMLNAEDIAMAVGNAYLHATQHDKQNLNGNNADLCLAAFNVRDDSKYFSMASS